MQTLYKRNGLIYYTFLFQSKPALLRNIEDSCHWKNILNRDLMPMKQLLVEFTDTRGTTVTIVLTQ